MFVKPAGETEFADRTLTLRYRFVHILYQNMLYATLQPTRRAALSGRVAASIVKHQGDHLAGGAAQLAILFEGARDFRNAAVQFLAAAKHAAGLFAFREAISLSRRGLKALEGLPEDPARMQPSSACSSSSACRCDRFRGGRRRKWRSRTSAPVRSASSSGTRPSSSRCCGG